MNTPQVYEWLYGTRFWDWADEQEIPVAPIGAAPWMVWIDVESTGLDAQHEVPLELGIIITDRFGNLIQEGAVRWLIFDDTDFVWKRMLDGMDPYVEKMHSKSGLLNELTEALKDPTLMSTPGMVEDQAIGWLGDMFGRTFTGNERLPACGSTVSFDRRFLAHWMEDLDNWFLHRVGDVSSMRYFAYQMRPDLQQQEPEKRNMHRVLPDIIDSIKLYRFLINNIFTLPTEE